MAPRMPKPGAGDTGPREDCIADGGYGPPIALPRSIAQVQQPHLHRIPAAHGKTGVEAFDADAISARAAS
jgi:hypothetical protein